MMSGTSALAQADLKTAMTEAILDEYLAEATYTAVIKKFGQIRPFVNIVKAEQTHQSLLVDLFQNRKWEVPANPYAQRKGESDLAFMSRLKVPETTKAAAKMAYQAEVANVALYDKWLKISLPDDALKVFVKLRSDSLERHLPAFKRAMER